MVELEQAVIILQFLNEVVCRTGTAHTVQTDHPPITAISRIKVQLLQGCLHVAQYIPALPHLRKRSNPESKTKTEMTRRRSKDMNLGDGFAEISLAKFFGFFLETVVPDGSTDAVLGIAEHVQHLGKVVQRVQFLQLVRFQPTFVLIDRLQDVAISFDRVGVFLLYYV